MFDDIKILDKIIEGHDARKVALIDDGLNKEITYGELRTEVSNVAGSLIRQGITKGNRVAVVASKSYYLVVLSLAIMKVGAIYAPLDPSIPESRLVQLLTICDPRLVIVDKPCALVSHHIISIEDLWDESPNMCVRQNHTERDPAFIIHTSGSTGQPKGVVISHRAIMEFLKSAQKKVEYRKDLRFLNVAPLFFDASILDIFMPLALGGICVIYSNLVLPHQVLSAIDKYQITDILLVSSLLNLLAKKKSLLQHADLSSLRTLWFGGESCSTSVLALIKEKCQNIIFIHGYGPTETTHTALLYITALTPEEQSLPYLPLGQPLDGIEIKVLNDALEPIFNGEGELYISGTQLMSGYVNNPMLTAQTLISMDGLLYYKSNDIVCVKHGEYFFVKRNDNAVKIRGYFVHLSEIECIARKYYNLETVAFTYLNSFSRNSIGLIIIAETAQDDQQIVRGLAQYLPDYMLPEKIITRNIDQCVLKANGKLDKTALITQCKDKLL